MYADYPEAIGVGEECLYDVKSFVLEEPSHRPGKPVAGIVFLDDLDEEVDLKAEVGR